MHILFEDADVEVEDASPEELFDEEIDQTEQTFDFITVLPFTSLYSGSSIEPLYFVQVNGTSLAEEDILIPTDILSQKVSYFEGLYLKLVHSRNAKVKRFSTLPTRINVTVIVSSFYNVKSTRITLCIVNLYRF